MNPFELLGVNHKSTPKEIDQAYRNLAKKYHPDINSDPEAGKKFKEIQKAYELLNKKSSSGMNFRTRKPEHYSFDFDIFSSSVYKGRNVQVHIEIELPEVLTGCEKTITYKKNIPCKCNKGFTDFLNCEQCEGKGSIQISNAPFFIKTMCNLCAGQGKIGIKKCQDCKGVGSLDGDEVSIKVAVPPGVENKTQLVFAGQGEESLNGGINGDLIVTISIKEHLFFKREGPNITLEIPVSYSQLCLGFNINLPCITKEVVSLNIPKGTQPNTKFKIRGRGVLYKGRIGDMIISLRLEVPKKIDESYENFLSEMEKKWPSNSQENWLKNLFEEHK